MTAVVLCVLSRRLNGSKHFGCNCSNASDHAEDVVHVEHANMSVDSRHGEGDCVRSSGRCATLQRL